MKIQFKPFSYFETGKRLEVALDNINRIDGMQEMLNNNFAYLLFDLDQGSDVKPEDALWGDEFHLPYWCELDSIICHLPTGLNWIGDELEAEDITCRYHTGYYCPYNYGDIENGKMYIGGESLPEEMEHQAEDGSLHYEYRGASFLNFWWAIPKHLRKENV